MGRGHLPSLAEPAAWAMEHSAQGRAAGSAEASWAQAWAGSWLVGHVRT